MTEVGLIQSSIWRIHTCLSYTGKIKCRNTSALSPASFTPNTQKPFLETSVSHPCRPGDRLASSGDEPQYSRRQLRHPTQGARVNQDCLSQ